MGEEFVNESVIGSRFVGRLLEETRVGDLPAVGDRIVLGSCRDFDVLVEPNGTATEFTRTTADATDRFSQVRVRHQPSAAEDVSTGPTWIRHALALTLVATPGSVASGGSVTLEYRAENRSTATQSVVASDPAAPTAVQVVPARR